MPDLYIVWESISFWIELKVIKSNKVNLSSQQIAWHTSHSHAGGLSFILAKHQGTGSLYLFDSDSQETTEKFLRLETREQSLSGDA